MDEGDRDEYEYYLLTQRQLRDELSVRRDRCDARPVAVHDEWTRYDRLELAEILVELAAVTGALQRLAAPAHDDDPPSWLDEAATNIKILSANAEPLSPEYRRLCVVAADCAQVRSELSGAPGADPEAVNLLERAIAAESVPCDDEAAAPWWDADRSAGARAVLVDIYWERCWSLPEPDASSTLDRVIELLDSLLDGADPPSVEQWCSRATLLGHALAQRSRGDDYLAPAKSADRRRAIELLRGVIGMPELEDGAELAARLSLGQLLFAEHFGDEEAPNVEPEFAHTRYDEIFALCEPVIREGEPEQAADAFFLCLTLSQHRVQRLGTWSSHESELWWSRRAIRHAAVVGRDAREARLMHAIHLLERVDGDWPQPEPGYEVPDPAQDTAEAVDVCEQLLDDLLDRERSGQDPEDSAEDRLHALTVIFALLGRPAADDLDDASLNRVIRRGTELLEILPLGEDYRGAAHITVGRVMTARAMRVVEPQLLAAMARVFSRGEIDRGELRVSGEPAADLDRAIEMLRLGTSLCLTHDAEYYAGAALLAMALFVRSMIGLPVLDRTPGREALRWLRIAVTAPADVKPDVELDLGGLLVCALVYFTWSAEPFALENAFREPPYAPDISGMASLEDDMQLLSQLVELRLREGERDPFFPMIKFVIAFVRDPGLTDFDAAGVLRQMMEARRNIKPGDPIEPYHAMLLGVVYLVAVEHGQITTALDADAVADLERVVGGLEPGSRLGNASAAALTRIAALAGFAAPEPKSRASAAPAAAAAARPDAADLEDEPIDSGAAILVGDGSAYPFAEPIQRIFELVPERAADAGPALRDGPVVPALFALAHHDRWLRERDDGDLAEAVSLARRAVATARSPRLLARLEALLARMLFDRYLLLGDHADLDAAHAAFTDLLGRTEADKADKACPGLPALLVHESERTGFAGLRELFTAAALTSKPAFHGELLAECGMTTALADSPRSDGADAPTLLAKAAAELPREHPLRYAVTVELGLINAEAARRNGDRAGTHTIVHEVVEAATGCPVESPHRVALLLRAAALLGQRPATYGPTGAGEAAGLSIDRAIALLDAASGESGHGYLGSHARCRYGLGRLLLNRFARAGNPADLDRAVAVLEEVRAVFDPTPGDPLTFILLRTLAQAYRAYGPSVPGARRHSRDAAKSVLSAHGRSVLLQSGARHGLSAARRVSADMMRLVRWCVQDEQPAAAIEALELGRGLVLHTATVSASVPELLREARRPDLAEEWERSAWEGDAGSATESAERQQAAPGNLRRRVLQALESSPAERRLLSAPSPSAIAKALRTTGSGALIHLVPGDGAHPGWALTVTEAGDVHSTELPGLNTEPGGAVERYLRALQAVQTYARVPRLPAGATPAQAAEHKRKAERSARVTAYWREALTALCEWAGEVAMGRILAEAGYRAHGRPPRLVLAPAGALGVVPWHAARAGGSASRYACQDAVISFCATARQLLDAAARTRLPLDGRQVLVVDPHGSGVMQAEARTIRSHFYPRSDVVGRISWAEDLDGPWTGPRQVSATTQALAPFLPGRGATSAALLIANSHAASSTEPMHTGLNLDPLAGAFLTVEQLLAGTRTRDPAAPGGLVLLANCVSDLSLAEHDEALTLSTVFLGAGATSVVGSRWNVVDDMRTLIYMYMFHHYLSGRDRPAAPDAAGSPADALRAAQLWMLDPARVMPAGLRESLEQITHKPPDEASLTDPEIWAAFTHHGL